MTAEKHKIQHADKQKELLMRYQQFFFVYKNPRCGKAKRNAGAKIS